MKDGPTIQSLDAEKQQLLRSLRLTDLMAAPDAPDFLRLIDEPFAKDLLGGADLPWGEEGLHPESARFLAAIRRTEEGQRVCLQADVEHLRKVKQAGTDQVFQGPLGFVEAVFPVRVRAHTVHCIWSGKMRESAFTAEELAEAARLSGLPKSEVEELARAVPVQSRKQVDRAMAFCRRLRASLEQAIGDHLRTMELTQQLVQSERTRSVGTLSGGIAHHFNNLLSVVLGYSSFIQNRENLSREATDALHKIIEAAQRGRRLTEEILAFLGSEVEEETPCHVHETLNSVLSLLESRTSSGVRVESKLDAKHDIVMAQPSAIRQIVFNLLTNAMDSMPSGGRLSISTANTLMATETGKQEYLRVEVADTGGGIPGGVRIPKEEMLTDSRAVTDRIGLKLSSVYGMVGRLEGTVVVSSEPGSLTHVQVLLPTVAEVGEARPEKQVRRRLLPSRIWVVDDDPIFREMCNQVLSDEGHTVDEVGGGREFREKWGGRAPKPDLIVMDFSMPEYNGLQLCEWLRNEGSRVPVILVSGFAANQPDIRRALRLKKTYFLQKPFSFREMADTVTVALGETLIGE